MPTKPTHRNIKLERREDPSSFRQHWCILVDQGGFTLVNRFSAAEIIALYHQIRQHEVRIFADYEKEGSCETSSPT